MVHCHAKAGRHGYIRVCGGADVEDGVDGEERLRSVRENDMEVHWFEPAQLRCRQHSVLRFAGLKPLDSARSPVVSATDCSALRELETQLKSSCDAQRRCVIDFSAVKAIRSSCRHIRFISIDVYCEPGTAAVT